MHLKCFILSLYCLIAAAHAQQLHLQGAVTDAQSGKPIAGSTIGTSAKNIFYQADNGGRFDIADTRLQPTDTISISCVGYVTQKMIASKFNDRLLINLNPMQPSLMKLK